MSKPESFILTTDYGTLKNDDSDIIVVTIPASITILPTAPASYSQEVIKEIGKAGALLRVTAKSSRDGREFTGFSFLSNGNGTFVNEYGTFPATYYIFISIYRKTSTSVCVSVYIQNVGFPPGILYTEAITETITIKIATFLSPFN